MRDLFCSLYSVGIEHEVNTGTLMGHKVDIYFVKYKIFLQPAYATKNLSYSWILGILFN